MLKYIPILLCCISCGSLIPGADLETKHDVGGKAETESNINVTIEYRIPVCENRRFSPQQTIRCLRAAMNYVIEAKGLEDLDFSDFETPDGDDND